MSRRATILAAGLDAFLTHGVARAGIETIAVQAGVSIGGLYHHFADKGDLAAAVHADALAGCQAAFVVALERDPADAEAGVRGSVAAHLDWCLRDRPDPARFLLFNGDAAGDVDDLNRAFFAAVQRWRRPHVGYGAMRDLDLDLAYALWLGPAQEFCRLRLTGRTAVTPSQAAPTLADAAWAALKATEGDTP